MICKNHILNTKKLPTWLADKWANRYLMVHEESFLGDPNVAWENGFEFVCFVEGAAGKLILLRKREKAGFARAADWSFSAYILGLTIGALVAVLALKLAGFI